MRVNFKTGRHRTTALKRARPRGGAPTWQLNGNWQQAYNRPASGAPLRTGEISWISPRWRVGDGERRAPITGHSGERDEAQVVREEGGGCRARRAVDCAVDAPLDARFGVPRVHEHPDRVGVTTAPVVSTTKRTTCRPLARGASERSALRARPRSRRRWRSKGAWLRQFTLIRFRRFI